MMQPAPFDNFGAALPKIIFNSWRVGEKANKITFKEALNHIVNVILAAPLP